MNIEEILHANLTDEQYSAVIDDSRNILCLACAGSGKSRTLAYKIAYLISRGEAPESIIAFTFTEKAAESIKRRVAEALHKFGLSENIVGAMFIGTLDAFCQKLLGDINAKYRQFDILDQNRLVLYVMSRFRKLGLQNGQGYFKRIKDFTDAWQTMHNENIALKDIEQYDEELFCRLSCLSELLSNDGYMDFSFAIYLAVQELKKIDKKEGSYIEKFKYLFVDEYQDINPIQEEFIKTLSGFLDMLFVVGDDDQAIYGWRGANVQNILTFEDRYEDVKVHKLLVNFRSTKAIIETANSFVQKTIPFERLPKEIRYHKNGNIQDLRNLWFQTREDEAEWVAQRIKSLIGTTYIEYNPDGTEKNRRGLTYSDFAVLIRGIRSQKGENKDVQFVNAMRELNIPVKTSGEGGIFDRPYAQCILSIMELLRNGTGVNRIDAEKCFNELVLPIFPEADKNKYFKVLQEWYSNIYAPTTSARRKVYPQNFLHQLADALNLRTVNDETALRDKKLMNYCFCDSRKSLAWDQKWVDFVPALFDGVYVLRSPNYNVAFWNIQGRYISEKNSTYYVNNDYPLVFVHYSHFNINSPNYLFYINDGLNLLIEDRRDLSKITSEYVSALRSNTNESYAKKKYRYNYYDNGEIVKEAHRKLYNHLDTETEEYNEPFNTKKTNSFYKLAKMFEDIDVSAL